MTAMRVSYIVTMTRDQANGIYNALARYHGLCASRFGCASEEFHLLTKLRTNLNAMIDLATPTAQSKTEPNPNQRTSGDALTAKYEALISELLHLNNLEVEARRVAVRRVVGLQDALDACVQRLSQRNEDRDKMGSLGPRLAAVFSRLLNWASVGTPDEIKKLEADLIEFGWLDVNGKPVPPTPPQHVAPEDGMTSNGEEVREPAVATPETVTP